MGHSPFSANAIGVVMNRQRLLLLLDLILVVGVGVADAFGLIFFSRTPYLLVLGWISLRLRGLRWRDVGFAWPPQWGRAIAIGVVAGVAMELFSTFVSVPFLTRLTGKPPDLSDFRPMVGKLPAVLLMLAIMWPLAAFGEELAHRGYVMNRLADVGGRTPAAWGFSLIAASVIFGWGHDAQELTGILQESFAGILLGVLYLASRRNLTIPIVAHGVANTVAFILIYFDRYPGV
jgi:hypothetical protein